MDTELQNPRRRRAKTSFNNPQIGTKKIADDLKKHIYQKAFDKKLLLKIPQEILDANPDKHFVWVNYPRLEKSGFYHAEGYQLLTAEDCVERSPSEKLVNHFTKAADGYIHRNEMVLAYLPNEEFEHRKFEQEIIQGKQNLESIIAGNPNLAAEFMPHAKVTRDIKEFPTKTNQEVLNG